ncbi:hypothetical protein AQUCO_07700025v1 [Aquilegia coerulea]|uniref:Uncharacterized protein n=1 Tax=Aquilegia coerulea TaxID=218851 RepID=A0A2G5C878_AQUCA|nr:hypothetical protein AQUCO_07700025v1 [Aquilegia coerulea]
MNQTYLEEGTIEEDLRRKEERGVCLDAVKYCGIGDCKEGFGVLNWGNGDCKLELGFRFGVLKLFEMSLKIELELGFCDGEEDSCCC